jgi:hypothetical protein
MILLTEINGTMKLVHYKVDDLVIRVDRHEREIGELRMEAQRLATDAEAREATVIATAKALREAKEAQDAAQRVDAEKSERAWSPLSKVLMVVTIFATLISIYSVFAFKG